MANQLSKILDSFYHDMAIADLKLRNSSLEESKLTYNSMLYLNIIYAHSGEYTASNIADMLQITRPSVTQKLNELEKMGYITKKQSTTDKRLYYIYINKEMSPISFIEKFEKTDKKIMKKFLLSYSQDEINRFYDMLSLVGATYLEDIN